jgi:hypothetical protein
MRVVVVIISFILCGSLLHTAVAAEDEPQEGRVFQLADAYQDGYLKLAAVSTFSIYSTSGIVFGDFANGVIDGSTAINALEQIALLQSVCYTSLIEVERLTPESDLVGLDELGAIRDILEKENGLLSALVDLFSNGSDADLEAVQQQLVLVEQALDVYTNPPTI